jgi:hypothetical protein
MQPSSSSENPCPSTHTDADLGGLDLGRYGRYERMFGAG